MAEELDIRSIWNKGKEKEDPTSIHINMMEKKGTRTTLYWIKTILWIEFWLNVVIIGPAVYYMNSKGDSMWLTGSLIFITAVYLVYYQFLIRQIKRFSYDGNVLQSLKKVYGYLRFYLLHYKVMIWLSFTAGLLIGFFDPENRKASDEITSAGEWAFVIGLLAVVTAIVGGTLHYLVHLIYGRKIKRLKNMVKDLQQEG